MFIKCEKLERHHKVRSTSTPTYLSELVQTHAPPRALRSSDAPTIVIPRIHTELARRAFSVAAPSTWNCLPAVWKHSHFQTPLKIPSIQTHLVLLCCIKRLCIFGPKGTIQICYYYFYSDRHTRLITVLPCCYVDWSWEWTRLRLRLSCCGLAWSTACLCVKAVIHRCNSTQHEHCFFMFSSSVAWCSYLDGSRTWQPCIQCQWYLLLLSLTFQALTQWLSGESATLVFDQPTFPVLCSTCCN